MACESCTQGQKSDLTLYNISSNLQVKAGDTYDVSFDIKNISPFYDPGDTVQVTVIDMDNSNCLYDSGDFDSPKGSTISKSFSGVMPDKDLKIRISVWDKGIISKDCEDVKELVIKKGSFTLPQFPDVTSWDWGKAAMYILIIIIFLIIVYILINKYGAGKGKRTKGGTKGGTTIFGDVQTGGKK